MTPSPNDFLSVKAAAETLGCSRTMIYKMMAADPDFQPDAYIGRSPKFQRRTIERKRQRLIEQRHPGRRGPGRPRKNNPETPIAAE